LSDSIPQSFDVDDLERVATDGDKLIMIETILAWADLDTGISRLIMLLFGLEADAGSILIGNMDLKTKVERIKALYEQYGNTAGKDKMVQLINAMRLFSACRNTIAHRKCIGRLISQPQRLVFISTKHVKGQLDQFEMLAIDHSEMIASAKFARKASETIHRLIEAIETRREDGSNGAA
jgi:hypothetical protein